MADVVYDPDTGRWITPSADGDTTTESFVYLYAPAGAPGGAVGARQVIAPGSTATAVAFDVVMNHGGDISDLSVPQAMPGATTVKVGASGSYVISARVLWGDSTGTGVLRIRLDVVGPSLLPSLFPIASEPIPTTAAQGTDWTQQGRVNKLKPTVIPLRAGSSVQLLAWHSADSSVTVKQAELTIARLP